MLGETPKWRRNAAAKRDGLWYPTSPATVETHRPLHPHAPQHGRRRLSRRALVLAGKVVRRQARYAGEVSEGDVLVHVLADVLRYVADDTRRDSASGRAREGGVGRVVTDEVEGDGLQQLLCVNTAPGVPDSSSWPSWRAAAERKGSRCANRSRKSRAA